MAADAGLIAETDSLTNDARIFWDVSEGHWTAGSNNSYAEIIRNDPTTVTADGHANREKVLKTTGAGNIKVTSATLGSWDSSGAAIATTDTNSTAVPTIGQVARFGEFWGGAEKYVNTIAPGPSDGNNGDIWFVREA